jgi:L-lactate dehydrogenase complex protein LldE
MVGGHTPARVGLFVTCLVDLLFPEVGESTVLLLRDLGVAVDFPERQTCCGQPALNSGYPDEARRMGRTLLEAFEGSEAVVAPSGSCTAMVRTQFPRLFEGTRDHGRARDLAGRTYELSEFLVEVLGVDRVGGSYPARATYHDSCHGLRELHVRDQGRRLLEGIDGLELVEMARPEQCCGFGGTFSLRLPEMSSAMADDKLEQASATAADVLVGGDVGCLMHLAGRGARIGGAAPAGGKPRPMHLAVLLAEARGLRSPESWR